jgi:hypothetical protein
MTKILLEETNIISLRVAYVQAGGCEVECRLMPGWMSSSVPSGLSARDLSWTSRDRVTLYLIPRSQEEAKSLAGTSFMEEYFNVLNFEKSPPRFSLSWTDSGNGFAVHLNGEPWAFIDEVTKEGYSKGMLKPKPSHLPMLGNQWDQRLYEKYF